jgi:acyl-CoA thioesterase-1
MTGGVYPRAARRRPGGYNPPVTRLAAHAPAFGLALALGFALAGCDGAGRREAATAGAGGEPAATDGVAPVVTATPQGPGPAVPPREAPATVGAARIDPADAPLVVFLGDSLTAGLGLAAEQAFPALVGEELARRGAPIRVVNAGVSGDTSAGGLRRVDWLLRQRPDVVVVCLGANDALRGQPVAGIEANLRAIVERARAAGASVLLAGIQVPPSYGTDYAGAFAAVYRRVSGDLDVPLLPFLLEGVAGRPELNLPDGIHPNALGHERVASLVAERLEPLVREAAEQGPAAAEPAR